MKLGKGAVVLAAAATLAGCGSSQTTSWMIDGNDVAITLERIKPYAWSEKWDVQLIVRRWPECQRRHNLALAGDKLKLEFFSPEPGAFIIRQGKRWYVTSMKTCELQQFKEPPPEPGPLVGTFSEKDGALNFQMAPQAAAPAIAPGGEGAPQSEAPTVAPVRPTGT